MVPFLGKMAQLLNNSKTQLITSRQKMHNFVKKTKSNNLSISQISVLDKYGILITSENKAANDNPRSYSIAFYFILASSRIFMHKVIYKVNKTENSFIH
jgi:hypothetical protein